MIIATFFFFHNTAEYVYNILLFASKAHNFFLDTLHFFNKSWWLIDRTFIILTQTTFWPLCPSQLLLSGFSLLCFDRYFPQFFPLVTSCCNASQMTILFESFRLWMEKSLRMMFSKMVRHSTYQGLDKKPVVLLSFNLWWPYSVLVTGDLVSEMSLLFSIQPQLKFDCLTIFNELYYAHMLIICCKKVLCAQLLTFFFLISIVRAPS